MTGRSTAGAVTRALAEVHAEVGVLSAGEIVSYIPRLALADPTLFGVAMASTEGHRYQAGDADVAFTLQSVSKPFVYALALADRGVDEVSRWLRTEPSGEAFNAISLDRATGRPANPMINAGAICATALVAGDDAAERYERIRAVLSAFAGRDLDIDPEVYASEAATGDRNRALAYLMKAADALPGEVDDSVDTYFRQCSIRATASDLAVMAATLGNGGVNPVTGVRVVAEPVAVAVLSVLATCGMYDASGDWLVRVGLPAKSGVSGGIIAVSPGRFGVAAFSPPLDTTGNSVRGVAALREVSSRFGLHLMHATTAAPTVRTDGAAGDTLRRIARHDAERTAVARAGDRVRLVGAQGRLDFTSAERVVHALTAPTPPPTWIVLDLSRVRHLDPVAATMLRRTLAELTAAGHRAAVVGHQHLPPAERFVTAEAALAWCLAGLVEFDATSD
ncbi:glutaminase A [Actinocatenispora rupis]|uniref:Glutaminase n=1 Tax=Actinocatenispora rupis TaxID=519421 RepID=A0A8J3J0X7_9ACTN|nr:glutaminase A [Actinocatenispora rupis]GID10030.1 hypothetical protein Aru02nite_09190 [Actinocatenispora rupis]